MKLHDIEKAVVEIIASKFGIDEQLLETSINSSLVSVLGFNAVQLTFLFFEVQKHFDLHIEGDKVVNNEFSSIASISLLLSKILLLQHGNSID